LINELVVGNYNQHNCEGKDVANYTLLGEYVVRPNGLGTPADPSNQLVQCNSDGQKAVNSLKVLTGWAFPAGGLNYVNQDYI